MNRVALWASAIAVVALPAESAHAWECVSGSCPVWCETVPYGITSISDDLGEATTVSETRRGMEDWTTRTCTDLSVRYTGRSSARAGAGDGQSVIGWIESGWRHGSSAIGVTGPRWDPRRNCMFEADMEMNGVNYVWSTGPGRGSTVNAYSIALHEGGHYYGLGHSSDRRASMYFAYSGGIDALGTDDQNGICSLYPGEGGASLDCTTTGCPGGQECVSGMCQPVVGDGSYCSPCSTSAECGGGGDLCIGYTTAAGFCSQACRSSADCPEPSRDMCLRTTAGPQCIRMQGGRPDCSAPAEMPGCRSDADCPGETCDLARGECEPLPSGGADLGAPCTESEECNSGLCAVTPDGSVCSQPCNGFDAASCPSGFYCDDASESCGTGLCVAGTAGPGALGSPCTGDLECAMLMCDAGICSSACQPGGAAVCPEGSTCQPGAVPGCGACRLEGSLGQPGDECLRDSDCASSLCAVRGEDDFFCTAVCTEDPASCPEGFACTSLGSVSVCVPPAPGVVMDTPADMIVTVSETMEEKGKGGCGCRVSAGRSRAPLGWLLLFGALVGWRRARRSAG